MNKLWFHVFQFTKIFLLHVYKCLINSLPVFSSSLTVRFIYLDYIC